MNYDFSGWATRNDIKCSDGRTIRKDAFKDNDGVTVPLVWNHMHNDPTNVLGHALLENKDEGVYVYGTFNDTESGAIGRALVQHGDIVSLSIYANQLKQNGGNVLHGNIREVSLVHAGANPGAFIDTVIAHSEDTDEEAIIYSGEELYHSEDGKPEENDVLEHADDETIEDVFNTLSEKQKTAVYAIIGSILSDQSEEDKELNHADTAPEEDEDETIEDVFNTLSEKQKTAVYAIIGSILEDGGDEDMKHNVFESDNTNETVLSHADQQQIIAMAKQSSIGSLQEAIGRYINDNDTLAHGFDGIEELFPEYKDVYPGFPELITRDETWVDIVMGKVHKSPISRVRTRQTDVRDVTLRAKGYDNADEHAGRAKAKSEMADVTFVKRTTDPQTIYVKDSLHRDDIIDITDFDIVEYEYKIMRMLLNEEIAQAILIGDGRDVSSDDKIGEDHIRPIWTDNSLYTIRGDVDIAAAEESLQGSDTDKHFGENYIYAEAIITQALYLREQYKGTGTPDFYCTPHLLNVMLLARDLNGRRIYDSKADLAKALNVKEIYTVEQMANKTRTETVDNVTSTKKLLGIFVNLADYQVGCTKGGEITKFSDFDIDFNREKYLIETRLSGALTRIYSAIVLEEDVTSNP